MKSIFDKIKDKDFIELANLCKLTIDPAMLCAAYREHRKNHIDGGALNNPVGVLDQRWYESLKTGIPDYSVYDDPFYICDIWLCWVLYSRKYLLSLRAPNSFIIKSGVEYLKGAQTITDLGCGFGYTTAGLKELFPGAKITGTNLETGFQFSVAREIGKQAGFDVVGNLKDVKSSDVVFASEYFEHFESPIDHLHEIHAALLPPVFIIANGFNGHAIGHFNFYKVRGEMIPSQNMNRIFNDTLRGLGYQKLKTKIWNNRPSVWVRI